MTSAQDTLDISRDDISRDGHLPIAPAALPTRRGLEASRVVGWLALAGVVAVPALFGNFGFFVGQFVLVYAILGLSVVVTTGYAGIISLMPYTFAGVGAAVTGAAMVSWGWPFPLALAVAALATIPISVLVGVVSIRLKGLYLAIATLTVGSALGETFFKSDTVTGGQTGWVITRPQLGPLDLSSEVVLYGLLLVVTFVLVWMIDGLRTSRVGRAMVAVRDNELEAQALGINVYRVKLSAFVLGGAVAGIGGSFLALLLTTVTREAFQSPQVEVTSLLLVTLVVVGGVNRAIGAFIGAVALVAQQQVFQGAESLFAVFGLYASAVLILILLLHPGGLIQLGGTLRDLTRERPLIGVAVTAALVVANVGGGWAIVVFLS